MDAVGHLEDMRHVVADQDDRHALVAHVEDQLQHLARFLHAERRRRLVHDDDAAAEGGRPRHRDALALAAGQRFDRLVDVLDRHQAEIGERCAGLLLHPLAIELAKTVPRKPGERFPGRGTDCRRWRAPATERGSDRPSRSPPSRASIGDLKLTDLPARRISPCSGSTAPASALISDDLPAPLSPITARISPGIRSKSAWSRAVTRP